MSGIKEKRKCDKPGSHPFLCGCPITPANATDDRLHPLARLDGDKTDGNPATLGLLDELLHMSEELSRIATTYEMQTSEIKGWFADLSSQADAISQKIETLRSEIESQENTGLSRDG